MLPVACWSYQQKAAVCIKRLFYKGLSVEQDTKDEIRRDIAYQQGISPDEVILGRKEISRKFGIGERRLRYILNQPHALAVNSGYNIAGYNPSNNEIVLEPHRTPSGAWPRILEPFTTVTTGTNDIDQFDAALRDVRVGVAKARWHSSKTVAGTIKKD